MAEEPTAADYRRNRQRREHDLAIFYEQQAPDRANFPTPTDRDRHRDIFLDRLETVIDNVAFGAVLELGTGTGRDAHAVAQRGFSVTGIDLAKANLAATRKLAPTTAVAQASAVELPFADRSFDAVLSFSTLMHISSDDVALALAECGRVLKPNGLAAFGTWGGADTDKILADDHYDPPRFFSLRTDKTWRSLVAAHASVIELTTWKPASSVDHYQWIIARFNERSG